MREKNSVKSLYFVSGGVFAFVTGTGLLLIAFRTGDEVIWGIAAAMSCLQFLTGFFLLCGIRKKVTEFADAMNKALEQYLADELLPQEDLEQETLLGKFHCNLKRLYESVRRSREELTRQKREIQEMVSDISHQSRTPLTNLKIYNSTLRERQLTQEKEQEFYQDMDQQIDKLDFLIRTMVKMSRLETGMIALSKAPALIYDTLGQALASVFPSAEKKRIGITAECDEKLLVMHDRKWTEEALFNILDNAVKYTPEGGRVSVRVQDMESMVRIEIADTGRGIPEQHAAQIFKRFYREKEVHDIEGAGLGLSLSREIVTRQGGYIQVMSEPGKGSAFSVFLPKKKQL